VFGSTFGAAARKRCQRSHRFAAITTAITSSAPLPITTSPLTEPTSPLTA